MGGYKVNNKAKINVMVNAEYLEKAKEIVAKLGLDIDTVINAYLEEVIKTKGIPFEVRI